MEKRRWVNQLEQDLFINTGWQLIHDGQNSPAPLTQATEPPRFFTRKYRSRSGIVAVVVYDRRTMRGDIARFEFSNGKQKSGFRRAPELEKGRRFIYEA